MTHRNDLARKQGTIIRKKLYYQDYAEVKRVVDELDRRGMFEHQSARTVDERGTYVLISYLDHDVVSASTPSPGVALARPSGSLAVVQRPSLATKPFYRQWWFAASSIVVLLGALCGSGYWMLQQLKEVRGPNIAAGVVGFAFVVVLVVWAVKSLRGRASSKSGGEGQRYGFHYTPCD